MILLFLLALLGCRTSETLPGPAPNTTRTVSEITSGGQLAYIGDDGNVYVTSTAGTEPIAVTDDATTFHEGPGLSYQRLAWSPDGRLAYASVLRRGDMAQGRLYVAHRPGQPARLVAQSDNHFVIYIYWSPVSCPHQPNCQQLAYLIEEEEDIGLRLVTMAGDTAENKIIGMGRPFYFSWAIDGSSILWHTGKTYPDSERARLALYNLQRDNVQTLAQKPAIFMAPAWSPTSEHWLAANTTDGIEKLQLVGSQGQQTVTTAENGTSFVWSPQGDRIAYALKSNPNDNHYGPIHMFDLKTGQVQQITDNSLRVHAFFWDPAGDHLAYLTLLSMPNADDWMQWRVYNLTTNADRGFKTFNPSLHMKFVMSSFNQYAQSHRFWSPDGRYLVYANQDEMLGAEQIWLVDTWSQEDNTVFVDNGTMGFWSWN